ncbi:MAG: DNA repair protein RecO [Segatella oulorum]
MMIKTKAIVLHAFKFGEGKLMVEMFTQKRGCVTFVVRPSASPKGAMKKQYFQPFTLLEVEFDYRPKNDLQHLKSVGLAIPLSSIPFDAYKLSITLFLSEFTLHVVHHEPVNEPLFDYLFHSIEWLDSCDHNFANFHLVYMIHLLRFLGVYPNLDDYVSGCYFDMRNGCYVRTLPLHGQFLPVEDAALVATFSRMDYANMHLFKLSRAERNRFCDIVLHYYALHLPKFPEIKSLAVLRDLF